MTDSESLIGTQLGDFLITQKIATSKMAYVYLGEDKQANRQAAVKVLTPNHIDYNLHVIDRFQTEAKAINLVSHDHIVSIYEYGEIDGLYFMAMSLVMGDTLADKIAEATQNNKLLNVKYALTILSQIASALDCTHNHHMIHRDVKPSNILIDNSTGQAYLTDFGVVLLPSDEPVIQSTTFGTPRYMAPEQATNYQTITSQSDIYSLAVILYEVLTGQRLFAGESATELMVSHILDTPTPPHHHNPDIPSGAEHAILKSLAKEPYNRHATASALMDDILTAYGIDSES